MSLAGILHIQDASGSLELYAGQIAGIEAAVHAMREAFLKEETEAVLLVDASNTFNSLNRNAALHSIRHLCPTLSTILINVYCESTELFVDGIVLASEEGTTQGDPLTMPMYALATISLISRVGESLSIVQVWYADDASAAGDLVSIRSWWDNVVTHGPAFGYYANGSKTWLVTKESHLDKAREIFLDTQVRITSKGRPLLGAPLGLREFIDHFISEKISQWGEDLSLLAEIAKSQPHAAYAAFTHGFVHKFSYLCCTVPDLEATLQPLEDHIRSLLIPSLTGQGHPNDLICELLSLPARLGGLGLVNLASNSCSRFHASIRIS